MQLVKKSKYHSKKVVIDGITFDSRKEGRRYRELLLLQQAGAITDLQRQVKFVLIPAQYETYERYGKKGRRLKDGKRCIERGVDYYADFVYFDKTLNKTVVEDAKGVRTDDYIIKRKLLLWIHKIRIEEV
ncbi:MAG: DUF1064 domain-containing protein [Lachnospiraceae bacterium]|nr:DUF1064 domain-containing protein [Lachnospiraceae bacterium]